MPALGPATRSSEPIEIRRLGSVVRKNGRLQSVRGEFTPFNASISTSCMALDPLKRQHRRYRRHVPAIPSIVAKSFYCSQPCNLDESFVKEIGSNRSATVGPSVVPHVIRPSFAKRSEKKRFALDSGCGPAAEAHAQPDSGKTLRAMLGISKVRRNSPSSSLAGTGGAVALLSRAPVMSSVRL